MRNVAAVKEGGGREGKTKLRPRPREQPRAKQEHSQILSGRGDSVLAVAVEWSDFQ
jgi:hypothetical protein